MLANEISSITTTEILIIGGGITGTSTAFIYYPKHGESRDTSNAPG